MTFTETYQDQSRLFKEAARYMANIFQSFLYTKDYDFKVWFQDKIIARANIVASRFFQAVVILINDDPDQSFSPEIIDKIAISVSLSHSATDISIIIFQKTHTGEKKTIETYQPDHLVELARKYHL